MNKKQEERIKSIALGVATKLLYDQKRNEVCCEEKSVTPSQPSKIDEIARNNLFEKIRTKLPTVYNEKEPIAIRSFQQWLALITRSELVDINLSKEVYSLFDEMNLTDVKRYFASQLTSYYEKEVSRVLNLHSSILRDYYSKKEKGGK